MKTRLILKTQRKIDCNVFSSFGHTCFLGTTAEASTVLTIPYITVDDGLISQILLFFVFAIGAALLAKLIAYFASWCIKRRSKKDDESNNPDERERSEFSAQSTSSNQEMQFSQTGNDNVAFVRETMNQ